MSHSGQAAVIPSAVRYELAEVLSIRQTEGRCLITNDTEPKPNTVQMVPTDTEVKRRRASRIEYALGIPYGSFYFVSTSNLFFLSPNMHKAFNSGGWVLLPATEDLQAMNRHFDAAQQRKYDEAKPTESHFTDYKEVFKGRHEFTYRLLPQAWFDRNFQIHRRNDEHDGSTEAGYSAPAAEYTSYDVRLKAGVARFPELRSHVNPFMVLIRTGETLDKARLEYRVEYVPLDMRADVDLVEKLYKPFKVEDLAKQWAKASRRAADVA
ncbi:hypothetical protein BXZ70DRAFT_959770 [Cristinia sonorae]|uniref:Uncharacterized protein n=1 Tax=Cristinia sonorae TaxID=1940300 RepID=A0A8K0UF87_9AGAR|nr:hypothetical protein BXZ70DRAFT_959770 [Cristinia sonorae]